MIKVGCCGFPLAKPKYAELFSAVEVQQTFYQPPRVATLQRWRAEAPAAFEFTLKAWQLITHPATSPTYRRLTIDLPGSELHECGGFQPTGTVQMAWLTTLACAAALSANCVLFQCPASFTPGEQNVANLRRFFSRIERRNLRMLWEPRGPWSDTLIQMLCHELDLVHVVDPFQHPTVTRHFIYYRLHGGKDYQHHFDSSELRRIHAAIPSGASTYVMFNNVSMLEDALRFQELLRSGQTPIREVA